MDSPAPGALNLVVTLDGRIVANGGLNRFNGRRQHAASIGMGVHDAFTGRGFGRTILAAMVEAADDWLDIRRLELTVYTDNAVAIGLYRKFGFEQEGLLRSFGFRAGEYVDAYAMGRLRR
jgi:putative acetyltransferase